MNRFATVETGGLSMLLAAQVVPLKNTWAELLSRTPSGAATSPEPGSNVSPFPQSTDRENRSDEVGPPVTAPPASPVQRSRGGGPQSGSQPTSGAGTPLPAT